jgi:hypothetical protein
VSELKVPWYKRDLLPLCFPGWLAASLLIAAGFAVCFGVFLEGGNRLATAAIAGLIGFGLALAILSIAAGRYRGSKPNPLAPPAVIRRPILTAIVSVWPMMWVLERQVSWPWGRGGTIVTGKPAEAMGIVVLIVIVGLVALANLAAYRRERRLLPSMLLSLVVTVASLAIAVIAVGG